MITILLHTDSGSSEINLPTSWADITFDQFLELHQIGFDDPESIVEYFTGNELQPNQQIIDLLEFLFHPDEILAEVPASKINIAHKSWERFEMARFVIEEADGDPVLFGKQLVKIYKGKKIGHLPVATAIGWIDFFFRNSLPLLLATRNCQTAKPRHRKRWRTVCRTEATTLKSLAGMRPCTA